VPLHKRTGEQLDFVWSWHGCSGEYTYEYLNETTHQYEVVQKGSHHFQIPALELDNAGSYRCWKRCNNTEQSPYCYFGVNGNEKYHMCITCYLFFLVFSGVVQMEFPPAFLGTSYSGMCRVTANPQPQVFAWLEALNCPYTTSSINISRYTTEVIVAIPHVTTDCIDAIIQCHACEVTEMITLNITESESAIICL